MIDEILKRYGVKYEELEDVEKETLNTWLDALKQGQITIEKVREYLRAMRDSVELTLESEPEFIQVFIFKIRNDKNILLKARLRNYRLLESFLSTPQKAKAAINRALAGVAGRK